MSSCVWECIKYQFGFFGAIAILGLLIVLLTAIGIGTGGAGLVAAVTAAVKTAVGAAGLAVTGVGSAGIFGSLVGCIIKCW